MFSNLLREFKVNRVVRHFIFADLALLSGWGLVSPIFSIFVTQKIAGADLVTVGIAASTYWLTRSILQIPIGSFLDHSNKERRELYTLIAGLLLAAFSAFALIVVATAAQLYLIQFVYGVGIALYATAWNEVFSKHLDRNKIALEWAMDSSGLGFASGIAGFLGAYVASLFGFNYVFIAAGFFSILAAVIIFLLPDLVLPPQTVSPTSQKDHTPKTIQ